MNGNPNILQFERALDAKLNHALLSTKDSFCQFHAGESMAFKFGVLSTLQGL